MLILARNKYGDDIDVTGLVKEDFNEEETESKIAALYGESLFHRSGQIEDDGITKDTTYIDLGDDPSHEVDEELNTGVKEETQDLISAKGRKGLEQLLKKYRSTFRIRLGRGGPGRVRLMKIVIDESKKAVKVTVRKYPADQRKFLTFT